MQDLASHLRRLDGRPYPAYRDLRGTAFDLDGVQATLEHVQGDPFASPSRLRLDVPAALAGLPDAAFAGADARRATADFVHRALRGALGARRRRVGRREDRGTERGGRGGSGKSGQVDIAALGQEVLDRTAVCIDERGSLLVRLTVGLPAAGRRILGRAAASLLTEDLPTLLRRVFAELDRDRLLRHVAVVEDQVALRHRLGELGLVAFVADGAVLPRTSGADDRPLDDPVPFLSPESMRIEIELPHAGAVTGLAVRSGVTLIVGGGYHGKSTLLQVLLRGVYDHIPGDGRELCATVGEAVGIRAEDGRSVRGVDLRPFIANLPLGRSTEAFDTDDASGSTSQAAAIVEALECGATALLVDEDTAATNFMIRDARMRTLVPGDREPITPFLDRVRELADGRGVSSILVVGGAGDYLDVADAVIQMDEYRPRDVTADAHELVESMPLDDVAAPRAASPWLPPQPRVPDPTSLDASRGRRGERVRSVKTRAIEFGEEEIEVSLLPQLVDAAQCRTIGDLLLELKRAALDGRRSLPEALTIVETKIRDGGLAAVCAPSFGDRAAVRRFEVAAALNRLRSLRMVR